MSHLKTAYEYINGACTESFKILLEVEQKNCVTLSTQKCFAHKPKISLLSLEAVQNITTNIDKLSQLKAPQPKYLLRQ